MNTGLEEYDSLYRGFSRGQLIYLAGKTYAGKTNIALKICQHISENENLGVLFFSMEENILQYLWGPENLFCFSHSSFNIEGIKEKAYQRTKDVGLDFICIDMLSLIRPSSTKRNVDDDLITTHLKHLACTLNVPVLLTIELLGSAEQPIEEQDLKLLNAYGNISQKADVIMFLGKTTDIKKRILSIKKHPSKLHTNILINYDSSLPRML